MIYFYYDLVGLLVNSWHDLDKKYGLCNFSAFIWASLKS